MLCILAVLEFYFIYIPNKIFFCYDLDSKKVPVLIEAEEK